MNGAAPVLALAGVDKRYRGRRVLHGLALSVARGEIVGLLGPNGSGKTTTLRIAAAYLWPDAGEVSLNGAPLNPGQHALRRRIGYLPERAPLYEPFTVVQYLGFVAAARGLRGQQRRAAVAGALKAFDLAPVRRRVIGQLSKGYRQRVGLAQALLGEPDLLLLDEPTNGLDPFQIIEAREMIRRASAARGVLVSTHIVQEVAALCTRVVYLRDGALVELPSATPRGRVEMVIRAGDRNAVVAAAAAVDPRIVPVASAEVGDQRVRLTFDLAACGDQRGALAQAASAVTELETFTDARIDLESILVRAMQEDAGPAA